MNHSAFRSILVLAALSGVAVSAQQFNTLGGSLTINGLSGPPYPVMAVPLPRGVASAASVAGAPNMPWMGFIANGVLANGYPVLNGQLVDLSTAGFALVYNGLADPAFTTNSSGFWNATFVIAASTPLNTTRAFQAAVADPASPVSVTLTAATQVVVTPGVTVFPITLTDDGSQAVNLGQWNTSFPFYNGNHTTLYINANGFLSFNAPDTDFTPTPQEMLGGVPRIAAFWLDLVPNAGGTVNYSIDQSVNPPVFRCQFTNVPEFQILSALHTFRFELDTQVGNIRIVTDPFNMAPAGYTMIYGISPGGNQSPVTAMSNITDFMTSPLTTGSNHAVFEYFGSPGQTGWTLPTPNPYDLAGTTFYADFIGSGSYFIYVL